MSSSDDTDGPKLVWTFPLFRAIQERSGILNIGNNIGSFIGKSIASTGQTEDEDFSQEDDEYMESAIDDLKDSSEQVFGQVEGVEDLSTELVEITDGAFVPQRTEAEVGDTVVWVNEGEETHSVMAIENANFNSGPLNPGEEFEHTFNEEEAVIYIDSITGGDEMSGAVIVGDAELESDLPSERNIQREFFSAGPSNSMSEAADKKQEMKQERVG